MKEKKPQEGKMLLLQVFLTKQMSSWATWAAPLQWTEKRVGGKSLPTTYWSRDKKNKVLNEAETMESLPIL